VRLWEEMQPCLIGITGPQFARETTTYVSNITRFAAELGHVR
jgi:hypothetical protein